ncbi:MAG: S8 family serine peptidase [Erysipelotrichaceae bacterium]|nr:S8 family serine peptidase [Erysipelotrichaceae bacterium]
MKRILSILLTMVMTVSCLTVNYAKPIRGEEVSLPETTEAVSGSDVDPSTLNVRKNVILPSQQDFQENVVSPKSEEVPYEDGDIVRVSIKLDKPSTLDAGFSAENIADNANAMRYRKYLAEQQKALEQEIKNELGADIDVKWNLTLAANVISAEVKYGDVASIEALDKVEKVIIENAYEPDRSADIPDTSISTKEMIYATQAWANGYTGAGSKVAIIDTGTNYNHISFDSGAFEYALTKDGKALSDYDLLDKDDINSVLPELNISAYGNADTDQLYLNSKIPFAYNYIDGDYDTDHYHDDQGNHGSHVAGISAANRFVPDGNGGYADSVSTVFAVGAAPDAQIITMKVFGKGGGAYDSDYMAAIEDAILLGADSINLSLGSAMAGFAFADDYQYIMESLVNNHSVVVMSAGNSGAWYDTPYNENLYPGYLYIEDTNFTTGGSPGSFTNSLTVAAANNVGRTGSPLVFNGSQKEFYSETESTGARMKSIEGTYDYVYIDGVGEAEEYEAVDAVVDLEGKVILTNRGSISFYVKGNNAIPFNPAALVVVNNADGIINMALEGYTGSFPMVSITLAAGLELKAASEAKTAGDYTYYEGTIEITNKISADTTVELKDAGITDFSSWGASGSLTLKPEITAPGGDIYSVSGLTEDQYESMSGTSMAAPHITGMAAVLGQYIRDNDLAKWTNGNPRTLINSLLMSTALPMKDGDSYYPVMQQGAGLGNVYAATQALSFIMMNEDATESYADGKIKAEFGEDPDRTGKYTYSFNITNMSQDALAYEFTTDMFTQAPTMDQEGNLYLTEYTMPLEATVVYDWSDEEVKGHDVDKDGDTDYDDVKAILDYLTGLKDAAELDLAAGEMDNVDGVSSFDAHLLIEWLAAQGIATEGQILVRPGETRNITVTITLNGMDEFNEYYPNGLYVEGFTYLTCVSTTDDGELLDVTHSIPLLGYYGSWSEASMFDNTSIIDAAYGTQQFEPYLTNTETNYMTVRYPGENKDYIFAGNPYMMEESFPVDRLAMSDGTQITSFVYSLIRSAGTLGAAAVKVDESGNPQSVGAVGALQSYADAAFYHVNKGV